MGLLTRALVPRSVRRAAHPVRTAKSAATPRVVKQARNVMNPVDSAVYHGIERPLNTKPRKRTTRTAQTQAPEVVSTNTSEQDRVFGWIVFAIIVFLVAGYVTLSLIFGWLTVFATTLAAGFVIFKLVTR
jgi:hypothetical protein